MKILVFIVFFLLIVAFFIISNNNIELSNPVEVIRFFKLYENWLSNVFEDCKGIVGNVTKIGLG